MKGKKDKALVKKIDALFELREIPWMLDLAVIKNKGKFLRRLKNLQHAIYNLDHTLESSWKIPEKKLRRDWKKIYKALEKFKLTPREKKGFCSSIVQYEAHELKLREGWCPTEVSMDYLYFYKSCDVKLIRGLIQREDHGLKKIIHPRDWFTFDLMTELNDDISDLFEDLTTYNGNRLVFEIAKFGKKKAGSHYRYYMHKTLTQFAEQTNRFKTPQKQAIFDKTLEIGQKTQLLLEEQLNAVKVKDVRKAKIFGKYKAS